MATLVERVREWAEEEEVQANYDLLREAADRIAALEEALRDAVTTAHQTSDQHPRGTGAFAPKHGGQWQLCPDDLCVNARALLDVTNTASAPQPAEGDAE